MKYFLRFIFCVVLVSLLSSFLTPHLIYPSPNFPVSETPPHSIEAQFLENKYHCWIHDAQSSESPVLIWAHGNGENLGTMNRSGLFQRMKKLGVCFIAVDYPGYGLSRGKKNEREVVDSVRHACLEAKKRWPTRSLYLLGQSLGSGAAFQVASTIDFLKGLIVISPFTSLKDVGEAHYPNALVSFLMLFNSDRYNSFEIAQKVACPVLIIHGKRDRIIPFEQGQKLSEVLPQARTLWLDDFGHNDILGSEKLWEAILNFVES